MDKKKKPTFRTIKVRDGREKKNSKSKDEEKELKTKSASESSTEEELDDIIEQSDETDDVEMETSEELHDAEAEEEDEDEYEVNHKLKGAKKKQHAMGSGDIEEKNDELLDENIDLIRRLRKSQRRAKVLATFVVIFAMVLVGWLGYLSLKNQFPGTTTKKTTTNSESVKKVATTKTEVELPTPTEDELATFTKDIVTSTVAKTSATPKAITDSGVTWSKPTKLADQKLFTEGTSGTYYQVASLKDKSTVILFTGDSLGAPLARFKKDTKGVYYFISKNSTTDTESSVATTVKKDSTTEFKSLKAPDTLTVRNIKMKKVAVFGLNFFYDDWAKGKQVSEFGKTEYGTMYEGIENLTTDQDNGAYKARSYAVKLSDSTYALYALAKDFAADDGSLTATWLTGYEGFAKQNFNATLVTSGCGASGYDVLYSRDDAASRLTAIGKTADKLGLYIPKDSKDMLYASAYASYKIGRTADVLSQAEFVKKNPLVLWQDGTGKYVLLLNSSVSANAECGKPVVYLYPTKTTKVSVKVDARITKSEPTHTASGWNVTATPEGKLTTADGATYPYLFWEGTGSYYPQITQGRVVQTANIETELKTDLRALGLNDRETSDFLEFWLPRMPKTTFTRLTWLDTAAMNKLAPLTISPKPDSMIRVFLDFEGTNSNKTNLSPQKLHALPRNGFAVVEWGGLLRNAN